MNLSANRMMLQVVIVAVCVDTPRRTPRWPHDMADVWSAECAHEELMRCLDHCSYRLGNSAARHELMTISLPSSSKRCRLAPCADTVGICGTENFLSTLSLLSAVSWMGHSHRWWLCPILDGAQPPMVVVPHQSTQSSNVKGRGARQSAWTNADVLCSANPTVRRVGFDPEPLTTVCATAIFWHLGLKIVNRK